MPVLGGLKSCSSFSPHLNSTPLEDWALTALLTNHIPITIAFLKLKLPHAFTHGWRDAGDIRLVALPSRCPPSRRFCLLQASFGKISKPRIDQVLVGFALWSA